MRFGISLISWMLPKILRIRRCFILAPLGLFLRGASIALVAMCFPALRGNARERAPQIAPGLACRIMFGALVPVPLSNAFGPCANSDPVPERTGKAPGARHRAAEPFICWI